MFFLFLLQTVLATPCLYESSEPFINGSLLTFELALNGCRSVNPCSNDNIYPLVSFIGNEIDDLSIYQCSEGPLTACSDPHRPIASSIKHALEFRLLRRLSQVGFVDNSGYWTFSNRHGEILELGYVHPAADEFLLGGRQNSAFKKWLCVCY